MISEAPSVVHFISAIVLPMIHHAWRLVPNLFMTDAKKQHMCGIWKLLETVNKENVDLSGRHFWKHPGMREMKKSVKNRGNWPMPKTNTGHGFHFFGFNVTDFMPEGKIFAAKHFQSQMMSQLTTKRLKTNGNIAHRKMIARNDKSRCHRYSPFL
jgi:hypothetical protein